MKAILTCLALCISFSSLSQIPSLRSTDEGRKAPLELSRLDVNVEVIGNIAKTTFDMTFYNPQRRDLEAELSLPLSEGQEICRYALDINGKLREGVIIEKVKARQAFEAVTRQNIDPGIVNLTKGNFFRTRVYPVPGRGHKRMVLAISETLTGDRENLYFSLPMAFKGTIGEFNLEVKVIKSKSDDASILGEFQNVQFDNLEEAFIMSLKRKSYVSSEPLRFTIPRFGGKDQQLFTYNFEGDTYFYLNVRPPELSKTRRAQPQKVQIFWDRSTSGSQRNVKKELDFLKQYLSTLSKVRHLSLITFGIAQDPVKNFGTDVNALLTHITGLNYDGATRLDQLNFDNGSDEVLLFSDGINTIGTEDLETFSSPVFTVSSSTGSNYSWLKRVAKRSNGTYLNLAKIDMEDALKILQNKEEKFISVSYNKAQLREVYPDIPQRVGSFFEIVGILEGDSADLQINYGSGNQVTHRQHVKVSKQENAPVSRIWASKKIASLNIDFERNKTLIQSLGQKHRIITRNTSFIVLDRVEDYVAHEIEPPAELRAEYLRLMAQQTQDEPDPKTILDENLRLMEALGNWYTNPPLTTASDKDDWSSPGAVMRARPAMNAESRTDQDDEFGAEEYEMEEIVFSESPQDEVEVMSDSRDRRSSSVTSESNSSMSKPTIKVLAWLPDAPYLDRLRETKEHELERVYFELKEQHRTRPAFFIQVADFFYAKNQKKLATRILSNTIELDLENTELLRVVAKRLLEEGEMEMCIALFQEILKLRPDEPQSHRDLALAYQDYQDYQKALDILNSILSKQWVRFNEIKPLILNELNQLISRHGKVLDLSGVAKGLIRDMPLDVRVTIDWSSNDSDIDLWVIDPNGEKCMYNHPNTQIGGKISQDFTMGYGPEEFTLKDAKRGFYTVYVNYFSESRQTITGPVTIYANLYTNYGTPDEKRERITIQLTDQKESRQIAQFEFASE